MYDLPASRNSEDILCMLWQCSICPFSRFSKITEPPITEPPFLLVTWSAKRHFKTSSTGNKNKITEDDLFAELGGFPINFLGSARFAELLEWPKMSGDSADWIQVFHIVPQLSTTFHCSCTSKVMNDTMSEFLSTRGVAKIFQRGGGVTRCPNEVSHQIFMSFLPSVVGCLLKTWLTKGGITGTPGPPWLRPCPEYLYSDLYSTFTWRDSAYDLRDSENYLSVQLPRTNYYRKSFSFNGATLWNSLPCDVRNTESLGVFKRKNNDILKV